MSKDKKKNLKSMQYREVELAVREINEEDRRVNVSFSSEIVVGRWYGNEILCHDEGCVNLQRLNEVGVALWNHDRDKVIGKIENATCDTSEKRCYCDIVFDDDDEAERVFKKVKSGTIKCTSVGYRIDSEEQVKSGCKSINGRFDGPAYVGMRWTPYEVSIVSVPADESVGVGRSEEDFEEQPVKSVRSINELQMVVNKNLL